MYYIGVDLGTSAVKLVLMEESGKIANIVHHYHQMGLACMESPHKKLGDVTLCIPFFVMEFR